MLQLEMIMSKDNISFQNIVIKFEELNIAAGHIFELVRNENSLNTDGYNSAMVEGLEEVDGSQIHTSDMDDPPITGNQTSQNCDDNDLRKDAFMEKKILKDDKEQSCTTSDMVDSLKNDLAVDATNINIATPSYDRNQRNDSNIKTLTEPGTTEINADNRNVLPIQVPSGANSTVSPMIVKSEYYKLFMEQVTSVKDMICDEIEHYKFKSNNPRVMDFVQLTIRLTKLIKILQKNLNKQLYITKSKKLEKISDTMRMYCEEDGHVTFY